MYQQCFLIDKITQLFVANFVVVIIAGGGGGGGGGEGECGG